MLVISRVAGIKEGLKKIYLAARVLALKALVRRARPAITDADLIRSILVIRIDRIGDVVLSLPAIRALKEIFPNAKISLLARQLNAPLVENSPYIAEVIYYDGLSRTLSKLRNLKFDIAVDLLMDYSLNTAIIAAGSNASVRAGFDIASRGRFFDITVKPDERKKRMCEHTLDLVRQIGRVYEVEHRSDWSAVPCLNLSIGSIERAWKILEENGISRNNRIVIIHPGAHFPSQRWMPEAFAELVDRVTDRYNVSIVILGGPSEEKLVGEIVSLTKKKPLSVVCPGLDVLAGIIAASKLLICNNSGPLHIAEALGIPTVSTMGPTVPYLWRPVGPAHIVVTSNEPCSPCGAGSCRSHECMKHISVDRMEEAVRSQLENIERSRTTANVSVPGRFEADKVLVINLGGIGDLLLSTPALRALRNTYPRARIYFLGSPGASELAKNLPYIDETLNLDLGLTPNALYRSMKSILYLRRAGIDLAINMRTLVRRTGALKIRLLMDLIGAKITAGRDTELMGSFFNVSIPESRLGDKYEMEYDLDMVRVLGADVIDKQPDLPIEESCVNNAALLLKSNGISGGDILIGIHPGGKPSHRWPPDKYAEVINKLAGTVKAKFVITGDKADAPLAAAIRRSTFADIINTAGILSIGDLGAIIKRCNLYICNDTAAMHMAAILKTPLVAIFGPGYLKRFDPRNISPDAVVIFKNAECSPCDRHACRDAGCLKSIGSEEVIDASLKLLKAK